MVKARIPAWSREVISRVLAGLGHLDGEHGLVGLHRAEHGAKLVGSVGEEHGLLAEHALGEVRLCVVDEDHVLGREPFPRSRWRG
jgi:hypothetical protein